MPSFDFCDTPEARLSARINGKVPKLMRKISVVLLCWCFLQIPAHAGSFSITPEIGRGNLEFTFQGVEDDYITTFLGIAGGYELDSKLLLEGNLSTSTTDNFFGAFRQIRLDEIKMGLGYAIEASPSFHLVPKIGVGYWELKAEEGQLFNPGPEDVVRSNGSGFFGELRGEFAVNSLIRLYVAYERNDYDFGDSETAIFGVKFSLE